MSAKATPPALNREILPAGSPEAGAPAELRKALERVLDEVEAVRKQFKTKHVHDLRVALRRCRSVALGLEQLDPAPVWPRLRKTAKNLLGGLGDLRDVQVMRGWIARLRMKNSVAGQRLIKLLDDQERDATRRSRKRIEAFDRKQWRKWAANLPDRVALIPRGAPAMELLALVRWNEAFELHRYAIRSRSKISFHRLRVAIKRLRDSEESFLPGRHEAMAHELKRLQDLLGDVHDLDVLWAELNRLHPRLDPSQIAKWKPVIEAERRKRLTLYLAKMTGAKSRWQIWRSELPEGDALERARLDWLTIWGSYLDPDPPHSKHVAQLTVQLFDGILHAGVPVILPLKARSLLEAAAILHDVGRVKGDRHHQKTSYKLIRGRTPPPGWTTGQMEIVASVARYHRGGLPKPQQESWKGKTPNQQAEVMLLAGILRLATAVASDTHVKVNSLNVEESNGSLIIRAEGYRGEEPLASNLAAARHLLESLLHRAIVVESGSNRSFSRIAEAG